jgi:L-fuculose-phosphate aldolase
MDSHLINEIKHIAHSMFQKNYFDVFHGSISARNTVNSFIINKKETILDEVKEESFIELDCTKIKDYRWNEASADVQIHEEIYKTLPSAKYISYTMPPYTTAYSLTHKEVVPKDYYGHQILDRVTVYDPKEFDTWHIRASGEIADFFQNSNKHLLLVKGFGLIAYNRDLTEMVKNVAILENSCKLLTLSSVIG